MNQEQILGLVRHALTFIGGILITQGLVDDGIWSEISGSVMTLIGGVWSILSKK
jgi:hypothetical protein